MIVGSYIYQGYTNNNTSMYKKGATELLKMGIEDIITLGTGKLGKLVRRGQSKKVKQTNGITTSKIVIPALESQTKTVN